MGDSIAVGTHMFRKECVAYAQTGISSSGWDKKFGQNNLTANTVIISLGTNDWEKYNTEAKLIEIRNKIKSSRVFWVEPNFTSRPNTVQIVRKVAEKFNDTIIVTTRWQPDKIHPTSLGYKNIAEKSK
jgi:lysophospholipase L1-like esterase